MSNEKNYFSFKHDHNNKYNKYSLQKILKTSHLWCTKLVVTNSYMIMFTNFLGSLYMILRGKILNILGHLIG